MTVTGPSGTITHALMTPEEYRGTSPFLRRRIHGRPHLLVDCPQRGRTEVPVVLTRGDRIPAPRPALQLISSSPIRKGPRPLDPAPLSPVAA